MPSESLEGNQGRLSPGSQGKKEFQEGGGVGGQQGDTLQGCHSGEKPPQREPRDWQWEDVRIVAGAFP